MAKRSLRKGTSSVYLQYASNGDSIRAEQYEVEVASGAVVLRFTLRPVDRDQRDDENNLHTKRLLSVQVPDERVLEGLRRYCTVHSSEVTEGIRLEIISRRKTLTFDVKKVRKDCFLLT